jgi:hypothetical protein
MVITQHFLITYLGPNFFFWILIIDNLRGSKLKNRTLWVFELKGADRGWVFENQFSAGL